MHGSFLNISFIGRGTLEWKNSRCYVDSSTDMYSTYLFHSKLATTTTLIYGLEVAKRRLSRVRLLLSWVSWEVPRLTVCRKTNWRSTNLFNILAMLLVLCFVTEDTRGILIPLGRRSTIILTAVMASDWRNRRSQFESCWALLLWIVTLKALPNNGF
jgi:hypothetical protein